MKSIFNSLGSNYDFIFAIKALLSFSNYRVKLVDYLNEKYSGETTLLYKGREAIYLALVTLNLPKGSKVGINGFTCYVVYKAIIDAGCIPVYLDIEGKNLNFSLSELKSNNDGLKVVIIQNTLGSPCDAPSIKNYCDNNGIYLIEDLAHSVGTVYSNGSEAGTLGDFVALSFSQDKMIDTVSGGALVIRNKKYQNRRSSLLSISNSTQLKDRFYPILTLTIRKFYSLGFGKILHLVLKKFDLLSLPISNIHNTTPQHMPRWFAYLALNRFKNLKSDLAHRLMIGKIYSEKINREVLSRNKTTIRFPVFVKNRKDLINYLKDKNVYISDIWYDAPIAPAKLLDKTNYSNDCPESEKISKEILNLPTHLNVTIKSAELISEYINKWLNLK